MGSDAEKVDAGTASPPAALELSIPRRSACLPGDTACGPTHPFQGPHIYIAEPLHVL